MDIEREAERGGEWNGVRKGGRNKGAMGGDKTHLTMHWSRRHGDFAEPAASEGRRRRHQPRGQPGVGGSFSRQAGLVNLR
jgi:hypothetical protein